MSPSIVVVVLHKQARLDENIRLRTELRDHLVRQLAEQKSNLVDMQNDAARLVSSIRSKTSKLMVRG